MALAQKSTPTRDTATRVTITPRSKQVRNAQRLGGTRINNDFAYLQQAELTQNASNDEIFNASYQKQGLQPTNFTDQKVETVPEKEYIESDSQSAETNSSYQNSIAAAKKKSEKPSTAIKLFARTKATANNVSIMMWGGTLWFSFQLPFALISLAMFGISSAVHTAVNASGFISAAAWLANKVVSGVSSVFGFDVNLLEMADSFFLVTYLLVLAVGILSIFVAYLQYSLSFLRPLSGEMAGLKIGVLLLAVAGYSIPLLNLFPWILLWMAVVWKYPK